MEKSSTLNEFKNLDIIVFGEDFSSHPHSLEHLMRPLFDDNRVIWVETIGLRSPKINLYDLKKVFRKILVWCRLNRSLLHKKLPPETVSVVTPFMVPYNQFSFIRKLNTYLVTKCVRQKIKGLNFKPLLTITSVINSCDYIGLFNEKKIIFVCVDEFSLWPGLDSKMVSGMEKKLIDKSDLIFATSSELVKNKKSNSCETILLTHGVDYSHFKLPAKVIHKDKVNICYFGLFDERTDQSIIKHIVDNLENIVIHIIGKVACDNSILKNHSRIQFYDSVSYDVLPAKIENMDIFILPYFMNELTKNINPLKLKEYLSTGRPVISTPLPEVLQLKKYLYIAKTKSEFLTVIESILNNLPIQNIESAADYIQKSETWKAKANFFSNTIVSKLSI